jgi:hypothetical protein
MELQGTAKNASRVPCTRSLLVRGTRRRPERISPSSSRVTAWIGYFLDLFAVRLCTPFMR